MQDRRGLAFFFFGRFVVWQEAPAAAGGAASTPDTNATSTTRPQRALDTVLIPVPLDVAAPAGQLGSIRACDSAPSGNTRRAAKVA